MSETRITLGDTFTEYYMTTFLNTLADRVRDYSLQELNSNFMIWFRKRISTDSQFGQDLLYSNYDRKLSVIFYRYANADWNSSFIKIAELSATRFSEKWFKLYKLFMLDYNPLEPFNIKLTETNNIHHKVLTDTTMNTTTHGKIETKTSSITNENSISEDNTEERSLEKSVEQSNITQETNSNTKSGSLDTSQTEIGNSTINVSEDKSNMNKTTGVYGFNSPSSVPSSDETSDYSRTSKTDNPTSIERNSKEKYNNIVDNSNKNVNNTQTVADTEDYNQRISVQRGENGNFEENSSVKNTGTDLFNTSRQYETDDSGSKEYDRIGNIGTTSYQNLFEQEREKLEHLILNTITDDLLSVMCRKSFKID